MFILRILCPDGTSVKIGEDLSFYCFAGAARLTPPAGPTVNGELITPNSQGQFVVGFTENFGCLEVYIQVSDLPCA